MPPRYHDPVEAGEPRSGQLGTRSRFHVDEQSEPLLALSRCGRVLSVVSPTRTAQQPYGDVPHQDARVSRDEQPDVLLGVPPTEFLRGLSLHDRTHEPYGKFQAKTVFALRGLSPAARVGQPLPGVPQGRPARPGDCHSASAPAGGRRADRREWTLFAVSSRQPRAHHAPVQYDFALGMRAMPPADLRVGRFQDTCNRIRTGFLTKHGSRITPAWTWASGEWLHALVGIRGIFTLRLRAGAMGIWSGGRNHPETSDLSIWKP